MAKASVFNIQRYCLHDGPGIRTTVFFKGCPLRCFWCHNPESQLIKRQLMYYESKCTGCGKCLGLCDARIRNPQNPARILVDHEKCIQCGKCIKACLANANEFCGREQDTEEIFAEVLKDKLFYGNLGGMTLSGGEPAMQPEASLDLIVRAQKSGFSTVIETCGYGKKEFFLQANDLKAIFYFDLKAIDSEKHKKLTGVENKVILENLNLLMDAGADIVLRLPLIHGLNDGENDLKMLGCFLNENKNRFDHAEIMKYHNLGSSKARALNVPYNGPKENASQDEASRWIEKLKSYGCNKIIFS